MVTRHHLHVRSEPVPAHGPLIAAPPAGGDDTGPAVDVGDPAVPEADEVVDDLRDPLLVGDPHHVDTGRRRGYQGAMRRHRLGSHVQVVEGDPGEAAGARAARTLLASDVPPTAVVAYNDASAVGVLDALLRSGVDVPGQVSVVGYDDSPLSRLAHVDLTTVSQESQQLMRHAVAAVVERLDGGRTEHREVVVPPRLVVRGTTGRPPAT